MSMLLKWSQRPQQESLAHVMAEAPGRGRSCGDGTPPLTTAGWCLQPGRLTQSLATGFHRFLTRFSGRRRSKINYRIYPPPWSCLVVVLVSSLVSIVDACSSRTTPKPRPPAPTPRPNITFHTYECPPNYAAWFCLNGATCFTVKIGDSLLYNCLCADGYMGSRCEFKDLDGSYLPSHRRYMLETASIAGGATIAVFSVVILCVAAYLKWRRRQKHQITHENENPEGGGLPPPPPEKVLSVRQGCSSATENLRTVSGGDEPSLRPQCPIEVSSADPALPLDRGDHRVGQGTLVRTGPPWDNV